MIRKESIDAIMDAARIEEVIGDFVSLKRRGTNMLGLCPFHNERTPSFSVSPSKGIFKCFGCGKSGNAIGFLMDHEHLSYPDALRYLARKYNIQLIEEVGDEEEDRELRNKRESLMQVHVFAMRYFQDALRNTEKGKAIGLSYLHERDFRDDILEKFQVGYSPDEWDALTARALNEGFSSEYLLESGLSIRKDQRMYDRFRGRVIFPILNLTGNPIAFAGRILTQAKDSPKYVNSPETEIYQKSKVLYGLFQARSAIMTMDECLLVEGYTDVMSLHQAGLTNVVASSGTSLTADQIRLISRFTQNITILYDGDEAGLKASFRGIDMILEHGLNVRVVLFPEGEDPDSYVRKNRVNVVRDFIRARAENFLLFKAGILMKEAGNDPLRRAEAIRDIVTSISLIPDAIKRQVFIRECSQMIDLPEQHLIFEMNKMLRKRLSRDAATAIPEEMPSLPPEPGITQKAKVVDFTVREKDIIRILLNHGARDFILELPVDDEKTERIAVNTATYIVHQILNEELGFEDEGCRMILDEYIAALSRESIPGLDHFLQHRDMRIARLAIDLISSPYFLSQNWHRYRIVVPTEEENLRDLVLIAVNALKLQHIEKKLLALQSALRDHEDVEDALLLLHDLNELSRKKVAISEILGRVVSR
ncbi:MAG TPA: DNA primase [Bacteroidales bacterium]|nr:DNA primase [Bacteroidales bacterium]